MCNIDPWGFALHNHADTNDQNIIILLTKIEWQDVMMGIYNNAIKSPSHTASDQPRNYGITSDTFIRHILLLRKYIYLIDWPAFMQLICKSSHNNMKEAEIFIVS